MAKTQSLTTRTEFRSSALLAVTVALAYATGSQMTNEWFNGQGPGATFFPAAGIVVAALLLSRRSQWPVVIAAAGITEIVMDQLHGIGFFASVGYSAANLTEQTLVAFVVLRLVGHIPDLSRPHDLRIFLGAACTIPVVGGVMGATVYGLSDGLTSFWDFVLQWWIGDALGILVVTTVIVAAAAARSDRLPTRKLLIVSAVASLPVVLTIMIFALDLPQLALLAIAIYFCLPLFSGTLATALSGAGMAFATAQATSTGHDFFEALGVPTENGLVYFQLTLAVTVITALIVSAEARQRERAIRAQLTAEHARSRDRAARGRGELLKRLAEATAVADTESEIAQAVVTRTCEAIGCKSAALCLVENDPTEIRSVAVWGEIRENPEQVEGQIRGRADLPLRAALMTGETQISRSRSEGRELFADFEQLPSEIAAVCAVPLLLERKVIGAIAWKWTTEAELDPDVVTLLEDITDHYAYALSRARVVENQRRVAIELQRALQPSESVAPEGLEIAVRYLAADVGAELGGDWFEFVSLNEQEFAFAIGDVVGRGVQASAAMAQLRSAVTALAPVIRDPGELLGELSRFASRREPSRYATALYANLNIETGKLSYAAAGHPPPLLIDSQGSRWLDGGRSALLCAGSGPRPAEEIQLEPGSVLVLYTDGLVERRTEQLDAGLERMAAAARAVADMPVEAAIDQIIETMLGQSSLRDDDAAAMVIRWKATP